MMASKTKSQATTAGVTTTTFTITDQQGGQISIAAVMTANGLRTTFSGSAVGNDAVAQLAFLCNQLKTGIIPS